MDLVSYIKKLVERNEQPWETDQLVQRPRPNFAGTVKSEAENRVCSLLDYILHVAIVVQGASTMTSARPDRAPGSP